jgi:GntR family transcriptional regulator
MNIIITNKSDKPIYEQIVSQIILAIEKGDLKEGDALPSMRALAADLRISVITTKRAFEELERQGFIYSIVGKGSFVNAINSDFSREEILKQIEDYLNAAISRARKNSISAEELKELIDILYN